MSIKDNWDRIQQTLTGITCRQLTVVAVTKKRSEDEIRSVIAAGATVLGENRVDEARTKFIDNGLRSEFPHVALHMIGHLQSRKARHAVEFFDCIQSVDSCKLAREIDSRCRPLEKVMDIMLEVNVSGETQKHGFSPAEMPESVNDILQLPNIRLTGLMTMAPYTVDTDVICSTFAGLRELRNVLSLRYGEEHFTCLSMGMTNDYTIAVEEGSTMVRIGTALFSE